MRFEKATSWKLAGVSALALGLMAGAVLQADAATIYQENFGGGATALDGTTPDTTTGGNTWVASTDFLENGTASAGASTNNDDSAFLAFTPVAGTIYTLSATLTAPSGGASNGWVALGFTANNSTTGEFWANGAAPWFLYRPDTNVDSFAESLGTAPNNDLGVENSEDEGNYATSAEFEIVLNTQGAAWTAEWFIDGVSVRPAVTYGTNPTIGYVGFGRENGQASTFSNFELTVVPEPGSLALLGLGGLLIARRRRDA